MLTYTTISTQNLVPALEFFVAAKREVIEQGISFFIPTRHPSAGASSNTGLGQENKELAVMYDHQLKFRFCVRLRGTTQQRAARTKLT